MAGTALDRQLIAPATRDRVHFTIAQPEHDTAIRQLLRECPMGGAINLSFEREPNFFASTGVANAHEDTILAFSGDRLLCMGRCIVRPGWIDGVVKRIGYLSELRLAHAARGRFDLVRTGYAFFRTLQQSQPADVYFTSIAADNHRARRLLERGARGFPSYRFLSDFVTLVVSAPRFARSTSSAGLHFEAATPSHRAAIVALLNHQASHYQLASTWTEERLASLARHGLDLPHVQLAFSGRRLIACAGCWDQRAFRQTVIRGYSPVLRHARPMLNLLAKSFGKVALPPPGSVVAHAFVSPLALAPEGEAALPELVASMSRSAAQRGIRLLTLGFDAADPRLARVQRRFGGRVYRTRLYQVSWPENHAQHCTLTDRLFMPEVALL